MSSDQHSSLIKTPKQLVIVVVLAFAIPIAIIAVVTQLVTGSSKGAQEDDRYVLERIQPVGTVVLAPAAGPKGNLTGEQVYAQVCKTCHEAGIAGAPKAGDKGAWASRIAQGEKVLVQHALAGFQGKSGLMPPKGGNPELTDDEVQRAAAYLANQAGAGWKEAPIAAPSAIAATAPAAAAPVAERTGQQVVAEVCSKCHETGVGGAPKIRDQAAWIARAKTGFNRVLQSALRGHAGMPARGGMAALSDNEIKSAVQYMLAAGGAAPATAAATAPAAAAPAVATAADGKTTYEKTCGVCHAGGIAGAPKFGDKAAWAPRLAQGSPTLYQHAMNGFQGKSGVMPPKGGNTALAETEVKAAVDYMAAAAK